MNYYVRLEQEYQGCLSIFSLNNLQITILKYNKNSDSSVRITNISSKDDLTEM